MYISSELLITSIVLLNVKVYTENKLPFMTKKYSKVQNQPNTSI